MAMLSNKGKAQLCNHEMKTFTVTNMFVEQIVFCGSDWVAFLGYRKNGRNSDDAVVKKLEEQPQFLEIFSQMNIGVCLHSIKTETGNLILDVATQGIDTLAIAGRDGSVTVKQLLVRDKTNSYVYDDVSNQVITSNDIHFERHSKNKIDRVVYVGCEPADYVACSGPTLYCGASEYETTLRSSVTQLEAFIGGGSESVMLVAGLGRTGQIEIVDAATLTRQVSISQGKLFSIDSLAVVDE